MIERLKNASYRTKNLLLLGGVLLVAYLSWSRAFSLTFALHDEIERTQERIEKAEGAQGRIDELKKELARMQGSIGVGEKEGSDPQQRLLERVGDYCDRHGLRIHSVPAPHHLRQDRLLVSSFFIEVEGDFRGLVELLHLLETEEQRAEVSNVAFYTKNDLRAQRKRLYGKILVQYVERA